MFTVEYLRQFRIAGYAIFDFAASFIGVALLAPLLSKLFSKFHISVPKKNWLLLTLPLSILIHLLFGQMTKMTEDFLDPNGFYILKGIIGILTIWGLQGIKKIPK